MRRGQGRTLLKDLYDLNPVESVKVSRNSHGQPIGSEARLLVGYLGIISQNANMLPINYESWHHMPDSNKNQALDNIKERFALEVSDDYIKKALAGNDEDRERVGISNRQKQKFMHTAGSRSFASVAEAKLFEITHRKKDGSPITFEVGEIMEKLKEKKAEYEAVASTDTSVNLENIDNRIITEVLGPERYSRVRFQ
ncbi:ATP-dependent helicase/deoxyribonuclease subunit B [Gossypium arboreum]|uniref:ATP-dependent helicase/deoxyribonuclease subunit B n=1 Tax=Gossypium arboreum TaxID=29729 RepID=A0A0B0P0S4_GOSAR|nr:ATP-dependent helicase/deoxyribonuclease subunit B [Gossypium arboreum]